MSTTRVPARHLGAVMRYLVDLLVSRANASGLPWGTVVVNVTGSFLAGVVAGLVARGVMRVVTPTAA